MNRHSLIFQISLFFLFLMLLVNLLFYLQYDARREQVVHGYAKRFHDARRVLDEGRMEFLEREENEERLRSRYGIELLHDTDSSGMERITRLPEASFYRHDGSIYVFADAPDAPEPLIMRFGDDAQGDDLYIFAALIDAALLLFYLYVVGRLRPLAVLREKIIEFSDGKPGTMPEIGGRDEIAELSREFNKSIEKIRTLQDSRTLFLRNIMHELNTPIAKGKLIADLLNDSRNAQRLRKIFGRFEHLLGEFRKVEEVTSSVMKLHRKRFRVVDILDNAVDLLLLEHSDIDITVTESSEIEADYDLISIALKNLIDNALKHGHGRVGVSVDAHSVTVTSVGEEIRDIAFDRIFNRAFEDSSRGLGLGLYITYNILKKHGYDLEYRYGDQVNRFVVRF